MSKILNTTAQTYRPTLQNAAALVNAGNPLNNGTTQASRIVTIALPAASSNIASESPITFAGNQFYVVAASANVLIQPISGSSSGIATLYGVGQGCWPLSNAFDQLIVRNPNNFAMIVQVWVGFDSFRNDQLILINSQYQAFAVPTYPTPNSSATVNITDKSGQIAQDINGNPIGLLQRVAILVFNADSGATLLLQSANATTGSGVAVGLIQPLTSLRFDFGGNYRLTNGGATVNAIVSEIYYAVPISNT
jgi:hypothetical protein